MTRRKLAREREAIEFGRQLAGALRPGSVVALVGGLGAGKTHVTKGLAAGLGYAGEVTSPTFSLVHEYRSPAMPCPLFHFDFYRLQTVEEVLDLGWDEYLDSQGICVVEWADLFPDVLPPHTMWWRLTAMPDGSRTAELMMDPPTRNSRCPSLPGSPQAS